MLGNMLNDLAEAIRRWTEKKARVSGWACLDLRKAYQQMAVHPDHYHLTVLFFHGKDGSSKFYVANSQLFGATAALCSFNRVSCSLWFLFNRMLKIPCGVFYDEYPLFSPSECWRWCFETRTHWPASS